MALGYNATWIIINVVEAGSWAITSLADKRVALHFRDATAAQNYIARNKPAGANWIVCYLPA